MIKYISILRGINVAGAKPLKMVELIKALEQLPLKEVKTYIQSGNVALQTSLSSPYEIQILIKDQIKKVFGYDVPVQVIDQQTLEQVILNNPFFEKTETEPKSLHYTFLDAPPLEENIAKVMEISGGEDELIIKGQMAYLYCPNGYGRTKYTNTILENKLKVMATTRNWNTVKKLSEMMKE